MPSTDKWQTPIAQCDALPNNYLADPLFVFFHNRLCLNVGENIRWNR